jgi:hypothetical protein
MGFSTLVCSRERKGELSANQQRGRKQTVMQ